MQKFSHAETLVVLIFSILADQNFNFRVKKYVDSAVNEPWDM